ncbi:hypothetical protein BESB_065840 [Besnoitia besnoiti]|uniref:Small-subunit processome Utp12 domain-containing protein n=1 Tax=Besnoitia besnoiti TaxID=94643 RepID=A0A2A9ME54_BESBE|nr:hypothetical protein BESB_065840 [Besnoitia besnoiti]PFH34551.1 hypothetical protein BESB_065840 [Besnoitia besnoiti]
MTKARPSLAPSISADALSASSLSPPPAALSCFSSAGRFLATAAASDSDETGESRALRSRVKVWQTAGGGECLGSATSERGTAPGASFATNYQPSFSVEWQRQFLGHSITSLLFVSGAAASHGASERLLIGTDRGMVAAADVTASSSKLLFSTYLGDAAECAHANGAESDLDVTKGSNDFPVHGLACGAGTGAGSGSVVALVGGREGSVLVTVDPEDGTVAQQTELSKPYNIMAAPSAAAGDLVVLAARRGTTESSSASAVVLYDVQQQGPRAKLVGGTSGGAWTVALEKRAHYAAGVFSGSGKEEQHVQLLVWKVPSQEAAADERAIGKGKAKKLQPICSGSHFEPLVQIILPVNKQGDSDNEDESASEDDCTTPGAQQLVVTLSHRNNVIVWALGKKQGDEGVLYSLTKLTQIDSVSFPCVSPKAALATPILARAAAAPGIWYFQEVEENGDEEFTSPSSSGKRKHRQSARQEQSAHTWHPVRIVRGPHAAPIFQCLMLRCTSSSRSSPQESYLPLVPRAGASKFGLACVEAMKLSEVRSAVNEPRKRGEKHSGTIEEAEENGSVPSLPAASFKRNIAAVTSSDASDAEARTDSADGEGKKKKKQSKGMDLVGAGAPGAEPSNVAVILRQALTASDARLLETVLSSTAKDKREVAAAVGSLTAVQALVLLQHLVQQQQANPATSIIKGGWIEEIVKQHAVVLANTDAGREQLVLLLLQVEERRRSEAALVKVKGRLELLLQQMQRVQRLREERSKEEKEAREPLVVHKERSA